MLSTMLIICYYMCYIDNYLVANGHSNSKKHTRKQCKIMDNQAFNKSYAYCISLWRTYGERSSCNIFERKWRMYSS